MVAPYVHGSGFVTAPARDVATDAERLRVLAYREAAERLNDAAGPADSVAAPEIGSLGFYYRGRVLDACGLVTPEAIPFLPVPDDQRAGPMNAAISVEFVQATDPEWVVTMPGFADRSLMISEWFQRNYAIAGRVQLPRKLWRSSEVVMLRRRDSIEGSSSAEQAVDIDSASETTQGTE